MPEGHHGLRTHTHGIENLARQAACSGRTIGRAAPTRTSRAASHVRQGQRRAPQYCPRAAQEARSAQVSDEGHVPPWEMPPLPSWTPAGPSARPIRTTGSGMDIGTAMSLLPRGFTHDPSMRRCCAPLGSGERHKDAAGYVLCIVGNAAARPTGSPFRGGGRCAKAHRWPSPPRSSRPPGNKEIATPAPHHPPRPKRRSHPHQWYTRMGHDLGAGSPGEAAGAHDGRSVPCEVPGTADDYQKQRFFWSRSFLAFC